MRNIITIRIACILLMLSSSLCDLCAQISNRAATVTTETIAEARMAFLADCIHLYEADEGHPPSSLAELFLNSARRDSYVPRDLQNDFWKDPFTTKTQPIVIEIELEDAPAPELAGLQMIPLPKSYKLRCRGADGKTDPCDHTVQRDDIVLDRTRFLEQYAHKSHAEFVNQLRRVSKTK